MKCESPVKKRLLILASALAVSACGFSDDNAPPAKNQSYRWRSGAVLVNAPNEAPTSLPTLAPPTQPAPPNQVPAPTTAAAPALTPSPALAPTAATLVTSPEVAPAKLPVSVPAAQTDPIQVPEGPLAVKPAPLPGPVPAAAPAAVSTSQAPELLSPARKTVDVAFASSPDALRLNLRSAIKANPSGDLNIRIVPANSQLVTVGGLTLDSTTDGLNGSRTVAIDFNGMTITANQPNWDKTMDRLPIFGSTNFSYGNFPAPGGQPVTFTIADSHVHGRYPVPNVPATLPISIRLQWVQVKTILINPKRTADATEWEFPTKVSDYIKGFGNSQGYLLYNEIAPANENYKQNLAAWVVPSEPMGSDIPALTLDSVSRVTISGLTIRDRTLASKEYILTQNNDDIAQARTFLPDRFLPTTGLRIIKSDTVAVENSQFFNLDGQAATLDISTLNYTFRGNLFQDIGGNALAYGIQYNNDYLPKPYGENGLFEKNGFYRIGLGQFGGHAICATGSIKLTIRHNIIRDVSYSGISTGFPFYTRGTNLSPPYFQNQLYATVIDGNLIDGAMLRTVDGGGIYQLGPRIGGQIINNTIRNIGPVRTPIDAKESYGYFVAVGQNNVYPAPVAHLYYDNGSFGWAVSNNAFGPQRYAYQPKIYRQTNAGNVEGDADPNIPDGEGMPNIVYLPVNDNVTPPKKGAIIDRAAWFRQYGVAP
jgi:hypothetical protein